MTQHGLHLTPPQHIALAALSARHSDRPLRIDGLGSPGKVGPLVVAFGPPQTTVHHELAEAA